MRNFSEAFDPSALVGARGRQFQRREDAFQQLVGDGLRELRGGIGIHVSPTLGQDGSIDVFLEPLKGSEDRCFPALPKPLIVECKDVDEGGKDLRDNLRAGWNRVARKLEAQAAQGWPGNFALWRSARAYVYAVSARLPAPQLRSTLRDEIASFFAALAGHRIETIEVLDWADLRALWAAVPRLADSWLGVGLETILAHADQVARFSSGFRSYLLEENLPFLPPTADDPTHPDALLASLGEHDRDRGLLIEGPGGVGKSRILMEVAVRADAAGWRVLHSQAAEPALTDADLEATVLTGSGQMLLVLDYFDQLKLDPERLRLRLLPAAAARGIRLALLANARPSVDQPHLKDLFDVVAMRPTQDRARAIANQLLRTVAPNAVARLGFDRLAELCGVRPIVALFIARELDRRSLAGTLDEKNLTGVRSGHLTNWLRDRLKQSGLAVPRPVNPLDPASPSPHLVAAAAVLAAAPQSERALAAAGKRALEMAGLDPRFDAGDRGRRLVKLLREMGWLELRSHELATAHDVVADEVVHDVLADRSAATVRKTELYALLAPALGSARTLGRLAVALRRVLGMEGVAAGVGGDLAERSAAWLARERQRIGELLRLDDSDEVAFALGEVVTGQPWGKAALESWDQLFTPFLAVHAETSSARHLLYRGLRALPTGRAALLLPAAKRWLGRHGLSPEASFVVWALLKRKDLEPLAALAAVKAGIAWLEENPLHPRADFVISGLLRRNEVEVSDRRLVMSLGLDWLHHTPIRDDRDYALSSMLWNADLFDEQGRAYLTNDILDWLLLAPRSEDTVQRLETGLRRLAQQHPQEAWVTSSKRVAASLLTQLVQDLNRHALNLSEPVSKERSEAAMSYVDNALASNHPVAAGYLLAPLLPLAARDGDAVFRDRVDGQLERFLAEPTMTLRSRLGFANACFDLVKAGAWPNREAAEESLAQLGINRFGYLLVPRELAEGLRDPAKAPTEALLLRALRDAELTLERGRPAPAGYLLQFLLPLAARYGDPEIASRLRRATERFWGALELSTQRTGFAAACYRVIDRGDWPDSEAGEQLLAELGIHRPDGGDPQYVALKRELAECLGSGRKPTTELLALAVIQAERSLARGRSSSVGYLLGPILPLAARLDDPALSSVVHSLIRRFLSEPGLTEKTRLGFASSCYRDVDEGAWPERAAAERLLEELGIRRPDPGALVEPAFFQVTRGFAEQVATADVVPTEEQLDVGIHLAERVLEGGHGVSAGFLLSSLLPLAARCGQSQLDRVRALVARFLASPTLTVRHRMGFAAACHGYLDDGAWPNFQVGEQVLTELGVGLPVSRHLAGELADLLRIHDAAPPRDLVDKAVEETDRALGGEFPSSAGYLLAPLLPLAARINEPDVVDRVHQLTRRMANVQTLSSYHRLGFASACYRTLEDGAWPDRETGERVLTSLGIGRPMSIDPTRQPLGDLRDLEQEALQLAVSAGPLPSIDWLENALAETAKPILNGRPKVSGFVFPPLLPLTTRFGSPATQTELGSQIQSLLDHPSFSARGRQRFSQACYNLVDNGAWPDADEATHILLSLGIERPPPPEDRSLPDEE
jgi:hypothetical protein